MKITIEIAKAYEQWDTYSKLRKTLMKKILKNIISRFDNLKQVKEFELSILLTNNEKMLELNSKFRSQQKTTNVLSFPDTQLNWQHLLEFKPDLNYMYLGDIAFGYEIIKKEATDQNKSFENHFIHLFIHSVLHLIGFNHEENEDAAVMENLEIKILQNFAIPTPY